MPGGNKNIKPEDGHQFQPGEKAAEKYTKKIAEQLANELLDWMEEVDENGKDSGHIFICDFLADRRLTKNLCSYLARKFSSFSDLLEIAKLKQEAKLLKYGVADRLNASMTKFVLINHHDYVDRQNIDHTTQGQAVNDIQIRVADKATIDKVKKLLNGDKPDQDI